MLTKLQNDRRFFPLSSVVKWSMADCKVQSPSRQAN